MKGYEGTMVGWPVVPPEEVELRLLLPARQLAALEVAAERSRTTAIALIYRAISNLLQLPASDFNGEEVGRPSAPDVRFQEIR